MKANRVAALALLALVPLSVGVVVGVPLADDLIYSPQPTATIPFAETGSSVHGLNFTIEQTVDARNNVANGMSLIGILVTMDPGDLTPAQVDALTVSAILTDQGPGGSGQRQWDLASRPDLLGWGYLDGTRTFFDLAEVTGPTEYELVYYAPPGTYPQATLRITVTKPDFEDMGDGGGIDAGIIEPDLLFALDYSQGPS